MRLKKSRAASASSWSIRGACGWGFGLRPPARPPERAVAQGLLGQALPWFAWLRIVGGEGGDTGPEFAAWVRTQPPQLAVEVVRRCAAVQGFKVLPRRWVVERTFGCADEAAPPGPRLRGDGIERGGDGSSRHDSHYAPPIGLISNNSCFLNNL